ncbi:MAG: VCBS repeat-containing protein [Candidatus Aegiribacteria sp.]|nr:VCBS repeat-containing protein [Candidatus Aegiribacteria sp.]
MILIVCMLICALSYVGAFDETQSSWQDGPGEEDPVTSWSTYFLSSENMNWNNSESSIYLDYAENCPEHIIDASAGAPYSVVSINMDSDTDTDLLVAAWSNDIVAWYRNEGNGESWTLIEIAARFDGANCARACDVNNDGFMDVIASAYYADSLYWFESDSSEYLWIPHPIARIESPGEIEPVMVGNSVHLLVCESSTGILHNFISSTEGDSVTWEHLQIPGEYPGISSIALDDIDADGDLDIVLAEYNNARIVYLECLSWFDAFEEHVIDSLINHPACIMIGNIDGDVYESPDIAASSYDDDAVYWYENSELGLCWNKHTVTDDLWGASGVCICDISSDEDDWLNIVAAGQNDSEVRWYEYSGANEWSEYLIGELDGASALCAAEIDDVSGLEIVGAAGVGEAIKYWSPGFLSGEGELISTILDAQVEQQWSNI